MTTSTSITGHAINLANFNTLITFCTGHGAVYKPTLNSIKVEALQAKYDAVKGKLAEAEAKKTTFNTATNERITAFQNLEQLCTKATNAFAVSGAAEPEVKDLQTINKKIQGPSKKKATPTPENPSAGVSTSQQSYDNKLNFFANFIQFLQAKPVYNPNETELQTANLQAKWTDMDVKNKNVDDALFMMNQAINARQEEMYNPTTGLVQLSKDVKKYARSVFGASSPEYRQINSIEFRVIKK